MKNVFLVALLFIIACESNQTIQMESAQEMQRKIIMDNDFKDLLNLGLEVQYEFNVLTSTGQSNDQIDRELDSKVRLVKEKYIILEDRYPDFKYNSKVAVDNNQGFITKIISDFFIAKEKGGKTNYDAASLCGVESGPCVDNSYTQQYVYGCRNGCVLSEVECLRLEGGASFCGSVQQACASSCCEACNP